MSTIPIIIVKKPFPLSPIESYSNRLIITLLLLFFCISLSYSQNSFLLQEGRLRGNGSTIMLVDTITMQGHLLTYYDSNEQVNLTIFWPGEEEPPLEKDASKLLMNGGMVFLNPGMFNYCGIRESFLLSENYKSFFDFSGSEPPLTSTLLDRSRGNLVKVVSLKARFLVGITEGELLLNSFSHSYPLTQIPHLCYVVSPVAVRN